MATIINPRDLTLSTATPRTVQVNMPSSYNWTGTLNGTPVNSVVVNALAGADHSVMTGNVHNVLLTQISGDLDDIADGSSYFRATSSHLAGANRALNALDSNSDYIRSLVTTKMTVVGSNPTNGISLDFNGMRFYQGGVLKMNLPTSGSPSFSGDITGGANINITGNARFRGVSVIGAESYAGTFNESSLADNGVYAIGKQGVVARTTQADGTAVNAVISGSGAGVMGMITSGSGMGVTGVSNVSTGVGVHAVNISSGTALRVTGTMAITSSAMVSNLNSQYLGGKPVDQLCSIIVTNSGTAIIGGNGFVLTSTVAGTRVRASGGNGVVIESTSDKKLKKQIAPERLGVDFIKQLKPVTYKLKSDDSMKFHGFIAQDIEKILKSEDSDALLQNHSDGIKGTDYICLIAPIVNAMQNIIKRLEKLENEQTSSPL